MPTIDRKTIGVAFDMQGCPNRCRHCWLGSADNHTLSEEDVRWGVSQFRNFVSQDTTPIKKVSVASWFREPDFRDHYRALHDLESELSDGKANRYELLSVWRLARDESYANWAKSVGPDTCQISFFGLKDTNDWFYRRKGAFVDALTATERLLDAGMKPRWQVFLTTKLLPELNEFLGVVEQLRLRERVQALGGEFQIFMHPPGPDHEARKIEEFRPTADQAANLPETILRPTRKHFGREDIWHTEADLHAEILADKGTSEDKDTMPESLWFLVCGNWDVFANVGTLEDWWSLGNLKRDTVASIVHRFENDETLGLKTLFHKSPKELARQYGNPKGLKVYSSKGDLLSLYRGRHCETECKNLR